MPPGSPGEHFARAHARDAAGDHDNAINELALGTRAKDVHCTRELGLRLLTGDRAPLLPSEGLQFLGEACDGGLPEAAARAAGILAVGMNSIAPNWPLALAWLWRSANAGWVPARRQLMALCTDRVLAESAAHVGASNKADASSKAAASNARVDWRALANSVVLEEWRRAPAAQIKSDEPRVAAFSGFITPAVCDVLIALADGLLEPARVYDPVAREDIVAAHRSNTVASFHSRNVELIHALLQARMSAACGVSDRMFEGPTVLHYSPGEQIANHFDFVDPRSTRDYAGEIARNGQRIITFLVYLNDAYDGGETDFPELGFAYRGQRGDALYFVNTLPDLSPDMRMVHAGRPITRGEKWLVTQFVRSRPTK